MTYGEYGPMDDLPPQRDVSSGAVGGVAFAATLTAMIGSFSIVAGLAAILDDNYMVNNRRYAFHLSVPAWGWIHLVLGIALVVVGIGLFMNKAWAGLVAIIFAGLTALDYFFFIPVQPVWSIVVIALCVWVIWSVTNARASQV